MVSIDGVSTSLSRRIRTPKNGKSSSNLVLPCLRRTAGERFVMRLAPCNQTFSPEFDQLRVLARVGAPDRLASDRAVGPPWPVLPLFRNPGRWPQIHPRRHSRDLSSRA